MVSVLLDFLFPKRSLSGEKGEWITDEERKHLASFPVILEEPELRKLGLQWIDRVVAASSYRDCPLLRKAIHTFKYGRVRGLDQELAEILVTVSDQLPADAVLCPLPLHCT